MSYEISDIDLDRVSGGQGNGAEVVHQNTTTVDEGSTFKEVYQQVITPSGRFNEVDIFTGRDPRG